MADKAGTFPPVYVFAAGHQFSHPLTMFDSISPIYCFVCLHLPPRPQSAAPKKAGVHQKVGHNVKCYITNLLSLTIDESISLPLKGHLKDFKCYKGLLDIARNDPFSSVCTSRYMVLSLS